MLDLDHPMTPHIFEASRIEDVIRVRLVSWRKESKQSLSPDALDEIKASVASLHSLNSRHFGASAGITKTLDGLMSAVMSGDVEGSWQAFFLLAETQGENFSTWAI